MVHPNLLKWLATFCVLCLGAATSPWSPAPPNDQQQGGLYDNGVHTQEKQEGIACPPQWLPVLLASTDPDSSPLAAALPAATPLPETPTKCDGSIFAIVSAVVGNVKRDRTSPAPRPHPCLRFFLFVSEPPADPPRGWTIVLPAGHNRSSASGHGRSSVSGLASALGHDSALHSHEWGALLRETQLGLRDLYLARGPYGAEQAAELPFDPRSIGHTTPNVSAQALLPMISAKYVKLQMLHIDVLRRFDHLAWADSGLVLGDGVGDRMMAQFSEGSRSGGAPPELLLMAHNFRRPASVQNEMDGAIREQARIAALKQFIWSQAATYRRSGFNLTQENNVYWMAFFGVRRTERVASVMDAWWLEIRRWHYRDQMSFPYVLWDAARQGRPVQWRLLTAFGQDKAKYKTLCHILFGRQVSCCRRCPMPTTGVRNVSRHGSGHSLRGSAIK